MEMRDNDDVESEAVQLRSPTSEGEDGEAQSPEPPVEPPDGGYGWVVVAASFLNLILLSWALLAFTVFLPQFIKNLDLKTTDAAIIGSIQTGFMFYFSVLSGAMISRFGCRPVAILGAVLTAVGFIISSHAYVFNISPFRRYIIICIFYGAVSGMGISLGMTSTIVIVHQYFTFRRALASGLSLCGLSIGNLIVGPLLQFLIREYSLRGALLIQGALILNGIPLGMLFRPLPAPERPLTPERRIVSSSSGSLRTRIDLCCQQIFPYWLLKNIDFMLYCFGNFFLSFGSFSFLQHLINACLTLKMDVHQATNIFTVLAAVSLASRLIASCISDLKVVNRTLEFSVITIVAGLAVSLTVFAKNYTHMVILAGVIIGGCMGVSTAIQITLLVDLVGPEVLPRASGIFNTFIGTSVMFGSPITGKMVDSTGDYKKAFAINGCLEIIGGLLVLSIFFRQKFFQFCQRQNQTPQTAESGSPTMNGHVHSIHGNGSYDHCHAQKGNGSAQFNEVEMGPV